MSTQHLAKEYPSSFVSDKAIEKKVNEIFEGSSQVPEEIKIPFIFQDQYLINGEMRKWEGNFHEVYSPVCFRGKENKLERKLIGSYPVCTEKEALDALNAASEAYGNGRGKWPTLPVSERILCVEQFVAEMLKERDLVAKLIMWEIGKPIADSYKEFDRTVEYINASIEALKTIDREASRFCQEQGIVAQVRRSPLGVVLCMGPFNYPLNETFCTLIPAILMGNTVIFKPPKYGTLLHYPLLNAFLKSFPKGVVNTIYGRGHTIIPALMKSGKIDVLTLIGSSKVANELKKLHPKVNRLRTIFGLDAKNAAVISGHANISIAVRETLQGALTFNGQRCTGIKIVFVHKNIASDFLRLLNVEVEKISFGMPWQNAAMLTPLPESNKPDYLQELIVDAKTKGAVVINRNGGLRNETFVYPAILFPVTSDMRVYREEQFGPVIPIVQYEELEEVLNYLITSPHGQQVSFFSNNATEIANFIDLSVNQVSRVNINCQCQRGPDVLPFTGRKDSAQGTLSISEALMAFSIQSMTAMKMNDTNKDLINEIVHGHYSTYLNTKYIL